ncbi:uncharacterized protein LOC112690216 isoform X2 [Sipha flava]|uniref:Uncharacterized protein LOC112690216 isoform X2 n=1 Tax=Sipha flava TaxID=143950 RepID=A0A8B8GB11_9HEMI|nr:uncharacterized protein LOC112690216 isoform X2 [Sipha flava]
MWTYGQLTDILRQCIKFESVSELWKNQPTYLIVQILFIVGGTVTLLHAFTYGGRRPLLWFTIICHGLVVECVCYAMDDIDNFWHSLSPIMFFGQRLPLYVIILYSVFYYIAIEIAYRSNQTKIGLMANVGLNVFLIDLPYDIMGIKFVHWTWHDTDPNLGDRMYWVPWTSYYFHMVFSASFVFWFFFRSVHLNQKNTTKTEIITSLSAIFLSTPCVYILFTILKRKPRYINSCPFIIILYLVVYYTTFLFMAILGKPENEVSTGPHEIIGPCNVTVPSFGTELEKRKYLCVEDYNEDFDFHCTKEVPVQYSKIYTICGTMFKNRIEYIILITTIIIVAFTHFNESFKVTKIMKKSK